MNPTESEGIVSLLKKLRADGLTAILVEHTMNVVMNICDDIVVLTWGNTAEGKPEILANQRVIDAYLGKRRKRRCLKLKTSMSIMGKYTP